MKWSAILVLCVVLCGENSDCEGLETSLTLTDPMETETPSFNSSSIATQEVDSSTVKPTSEVTPTSNTISSTASSFDRTTVYEQLEEHFRNELHEMKTQVSVLESQIRELRPHPRVNDPRAGSKSYHLPGNNSNSRKNSEILHKLDQIYQRISNGCDCNTQLLHKVEKIYGKLFESTDETPAAGTRFCGTKSAKNGVANGESETVPTIDNRFKGEAETLTHRKYLGCYQDRAVSRILKGMTKYNQFNNVDACIDACRRENYVYAGMEGKWCRCDNSLPSLPDDGFLYDSKWDDSKCNIPCPSMLSQSCGGMGLIFSLYEIGQPTYEEIVSGEANGGIVY